MNADNPKFLFYRRSSARGPTRTRGCGGCFCWLFLLRYRSIVNAVEQQLVRSMGLRAEGDLGSKQVHLAFADFGRRRCDAVLQIVLAPSPAAAQRRFAIEPHQRLDT